VGLSPSYNLQDSSGGSTAHQTSLSGVGQINLFNGFRDVAGLRRAELTAEQRRLLLLDQQTALLINVAETYYQVLRDESAVRVLEVSIQYQEARVRDTTARVRLGVASLLDLAQSRSELAATRVSLTQARTDAANARAALAYLIGVGRVLGPLTDAFSVPSPLPGLGLFQAIAAEQRADLLAARYAVRAARQNVAVAFGQYYPSVSFSLDYLLFRDPDVGGLWSLGLSGNVPIFSAGRIEADVRAAWSQYRQASLAESNTRRQIAQQVEQAYHNLAGSTRQLGDLAEEVDAARQSLELAERSYQLGSATNLDVLSAQSTLQNAQRQLADERFAEKTFYLDLLRQVGQLNLKTPAELPPTTQPATGPASLPAYPQRIGAKTGAF
jgi:outer membrane protein